MSAPQRLSLYPAIEPYRTGRLAVTGGHEIYFEECGSPQALAAIGRLVGLDAWRSPTQRSTPTASRS